jgi:hypothetical protein
MQDQMRLRRMTASDINNKPGDDGGSSRRRQHKGGSALVEQ